MLRIVEKRPRRELVLERLGEHQSRRATRREIRDPQQEPVVSQDVEGGIVFGVVADVHVARPCSAPPTFNASSIGVPGGNVGLIASTKSLLLTFVSPGRIFP